MRNFFDSYWYATVLCYDNEGQSGEGEGNPAANSPPPNTPPAEGGSGEGDGKVFTQDEVNAFLANDRRKHQEKYQQLETSYQELMNNQNLTKEDREELQRQLEDLQNKHRTKEQTLAHEKKQIEEQLSSQVKEWQEKAGKTWEMYQNETISRSLLDAAGPDAFSGTQIADLLRPHTKFVEQKDVNGHPTGQYEVFVDLQDKDVETGEPTTTTRTPQDAVKRMKELPEIYGNLFKSNVVSGIGGNSATGGVTAGANGRVDVRKLSPQQYRELREKNPELLGLSKRR